MRDLSFVFCTPNGRFFFFANITTSLCETFALLCSALKLSVTATTRGNTRLHSLAEHTNRCYWSVIIKLDIAKILKKDIDSLTAF